MSLMATAVMLRLPSILWPFTLNVDENTFLVVAQRTLHGELPYTTTFDNKSPWAVAFESMALFVVGPDPHYLRMVAALLLGVTAFLLVTAAPGLALPVPAYAVGLLFITAWGAIPDGLAWMTELNIALVFAGGYLLVIQRRTDDWWQPVLTGTLVGLLPLVRANWALVAACLAIWYCIQVRSSRPIGLFVGGALLPMAITVVIYALAGALDRLWLGAVVLPRMLAGADGFRLPSLFDNQLPMHWLLLLTVTSAAVIMNMQINRVRGRQSSAVDWLIMACAWTLTVGAVPQPFDWPHQTLQMLPIVSLAIGRLLASAPRYQVATVVPVLAATLSLLYWFAADTLVNYDWRREAASEDALTHAVASIPAIDSKSLWIPSFQHYLSWRLDKPPVAPIATHPFLLWDQGAQQALFGTTLTAHDPSSTVDR